MDGEVGIARSTLLHTDSNGKLNMNDRNQTICRGPLSRRTFLTTGMLGISGLSLSDVFRLRAAAGESNVVPETSVIFVWLPGGPPHMDTYDMKPDAPREYRGEYQPIHTNVPGIDICEHLPLHAQCADKYTLIRSFTHEFSNHGGAHKFVLSGQIPNELAGMVNEAPAVGSVVSKVREGVNNGLPNYISTTDADRADVHTYTFGAAYLGPAYVPFNVPGDPTEPDFEVKNIAIDNAIADRLDDRLRLLRGFDNLRGEIDASRVMDSVDAFNQQAVGMLTSDRARTAFDLSLEPDALRDRYGRHAWGQRALLARRLVEAGCSFVSVVMESPYVSGVPKLVNGIYNWDSHGLNCHIFEDGQVRLPIYDRALTALIEDLHDRGLTEKVMLISAGEFGRTPRINVQKGLYNGGIEQPGRDHWPQVMSALVCGGGMRHGQVLGSTNSLGEYPQSRPLSPNDLWATVYRHLGIDTEATFNDRSGRPMPILPFGSPITELL